MSEESDNNTLDWVDKAVAYFDEMPADSRRFLDLGTFGLAASVAERLTVLGIRARDATPEIVKAILATVKT